MTCTNETRLRDGQRVCTYCGSITVGAAIELMTKPGTRFSGADWKYGWPHKFYFEPLNPDARECFNGSSSHIDDKRVDGSHPDDYWTCHAHGAEIRIGSEGFVDQKRKDPCGCPRDKAMGHWSRASRGVYERLHFKFYNSHLQLATDDELKKFSELSDKVFGISFARDEKGIKWHSRGSGGFYGYQQYGLIGDDGASNVEYPKAARQ